MQRARPTPVTPVKLGNADQGEALTPPWDVTKTTNASAWDQKRRLADAMRLVIERPGAEQRSGGRAARRRPTRLSATRSSWPPIRGSSNFHGYAESANAGDVGAFFDQSPLLGLANPLAPPITIGKTGDRTARAEVTFGSAYEGPPGCVHGGYVAAAFDEVLGFVQSLSENAGMTGTLTIIYRKPTPLHTRLRFEAELLGSEGRKIFTKAQLYAGEMLTAEAEGLFVSIDRARFENLLEARAERERIARAKCSLRPLAALPELVERVLVAGVALCWRRRRRPGCRSAEPSAHGTMRPGACGSGCRWPIGRSSHPSLRGSGLRGT